MLLKIGSIGKEVIEWQKFLSRKGYAVGPIDGIFGTKADLATKEWQSMNRLTADGIVGKKTLEKAGVDLTPDEEEESAPVPSKLPSNYYPPKPNFSSPTQAQVKAMFGSFTWIRKNKSEIAITNNWIDRNIVLTHIRQLEGVYGAPKDGYIRLHRLAVTPIVNVFDEIEERGLLDRIISFAGSFYPRLVRGSDTVLSNHSWGTAVDLNAPENWLGRQPAKIGQKGCLLELVPIFNKYGFFWGGHYKRRLDGMHFELARI
jgi:hypothetical protein